MEPMGDRPQLAVSCSTLDGAQVIELTGELDLGSIHEFDEALAAASPAGVTCVDLSGLSFLDSTGLAGIVRAHQNAEECGGELVLVAPAGTVRRTLETSGLVTLLHVVEDRAAALSRRGRPPPRR
jgi:anti-sigma B factor antagonist